MSTDPHLSDCLRVGLGFAMNAAQARHHGTLTTIHLLYALLHDPDAGDVLDSCGADLDALERDLEALLGTPMDPSPSDEIGAPEVGAFTPVFRLAWERSCDRSEINGVDLLGALLAYDPFAAQLARPLQQAGMLLEDARVVLLRHGITAMHVLAARSLPPHAEVELAPGSAAIVVHNDDVTPMVFVADLLRCELGLGHAAAVRAMLAVHQFGYHDVAIRDRAAALRIVESMVSRARAEKLPLRVTVRLK